MTNTRDYIEKDYYAALGVPKDADKAVIKKAYRKLAKALHPDSNAGDAKAEERFKAVSEAYAVLSDDAKRKEYDEARELFAQGGFRGAPGGGGFSFDLGDLFGGGAGGAGSPGGLGDLFGNLFGGGRAGTRRTAARRGADVESEVTLAFTDAVDGVTVPLRMTSPEPCQACRGTGARAGTTPRVCPTCSGSGQVAQLQGGFAFAEPCRDCRGRGLIVDDPCPVCHGSGKAMSDRTMQVRIPAGVADGQRIRLAGKGQPGENGGPAGDLYVVVHVRPHELFGRKGANLTLTVPVTFPEAALGAKISVPTLNGSPVTVRLPEGTQNGRVLRVRGRGTTRKDGSKGDLLVTVRVVVPEQLDAAAREALSAYAEATAGDNPRGTFARGGGKA